MLGCPSFVETWRLAKKLHDDPWRIREQTVEMWVMAAISAMLPFQLAAVVLFIGIHVAAFICVAVVVLVGLVRIVLGLPGVLLPVLLPVCRELGGLIVERLRESPRNLFDSWRSNRELHQLARQVNYARRQLEEPVYVWREERPWYARPFYSLKDKLWWFRHEGTFDPGVAIERRVRNQMGDETFEGIMDHLDQRVSNRFESMEERLTNLDEVDRISKQVFAEWNPPPAPDKEEGDKTRPIVRAITLRNKFNKN